MSREDIRARIRATANPKPVLVTDIPAWGPFYVKLATVNEIEEVPEAMDQRTRVAWGIASSICDEDGVLVYDRRNDADLAELRGLPTTLIGQLNTRISEINATSFEAATDLGNGSAPEIASS